MAKSRAAARDVRAAVSRGRSRLGIALYIAAAALSIWQPLAGLVLAAVLPIFYGLTSGGWTKHRKSRAMG